MKSDDEKTGCLVLGALLLALIVSLAICSFHSMRLEYFIKIETLRATQRTDWSKVTLSKTIGPDHKEYGIIYTGDSIIAYKPLRNE